MYILSQSVFPPSHKSSIYWDTFTSLCVTHVGNSYRCTHFRVWRGRRPPPIMKRMTTPPPPEGWFLSKSRFLGTFTFFNFLCDSRVPLLQLKWVPSFVLETAYIFLRFPKNKLSFRSHKYPFSNASSPLFPKKGTSPPSDGDFKSLEGPSTPRPSSSAEIRGHVARSRKWGRGTKSLHFLGQKGVEIRGATNSAAPSAHANPTILLFSSFIAFFLNKFSKNWHLSQKQFSYEY